eukprot:TRINITY_DN3443_c0_g1_i3.p1 TRINITY_DN3443_c0_g1~~TRINITY_DN3443_c0_g1_i3.p1  ORF type:complete len:1490 (-),score=547.81 TRINITY_DN3443_c0_g1_i3:1460-5929(-)
MRWAQHRCYCSFARTISDMRGRQHKGPGQGRQGGMPGGAPLGVPVPPAESPRPPAPTPIILPSVVASSSTFQPSGLTASSVPFTPSSLLLAVPSAPAPVVPAPAPAGPAVASPQQQARKQGKNPPTPRSKPPAFKSAPALKDPAGTPQPAAGDADSDRRRNKQPRDPAKDRSRPKDNANKNKQTTGPQSAASSSSSTNTPANSAPLTPAPPTEEEKLRKEEEERKKKADAEALKLEQERKREAEEEALEEERRRKDQEEAARRRAVLQAKLDMRQETIAAAQRRPDETFLKTLDSNLKRNTGFIKKIVLLTDEKKDSVAAELLQLNLSRYVSEIVNALIEAKLKPTDVTAAVKVASLMHQRYAEFTPLLVPALQKWFAPSKAGGVAADTEQEKTTRYGKRRVYLRLLSDLLICGVITDPTILLTVLKWLMAADDTKDPPKDKEAPYHTLNLISSFLKYAAEDLLGIKPTPPATKKQAPSKTATTSSSSSTSSSSDTPTNTKDSAEQSEEDRAAGSPEGVSPYVEMIMTQDQHKQFLSLIDSYFTLICGVLVHDHVALRERERDNLHTLMNKGELSEASQTAYDVMRKSYERLIALTQSLCEALGRDMPDLPEEQGRTRVEITHVAGHVTRLDGAGEGVDSPFDDEDTRTFYESLPDLKLLVPGILLGETSAPASSTPQTATTSTPATTAKTEAETPAATTAEAEGKEGVKEASQEKDKDKDREQKEEADAKEDGKVSVELDTLLARLPTCVSRDLIDSASVEFCYVNSRSNRKKLVKAIFNVPRTSLVLFPYYSRMIATLQQYMKDVAPMLVDMLEEEFTYMFHKKDQINIESKIRNIRLLGELAKFRVCPVNLIFTCLKMCLDDFAHHNIDVAVNLLEVCGRFMYRCPETNVRMSNLLDHLMRLKNVKNLDSRHSTMVENAYYLCKPPDRPARALSKVLPPLERYVHHLLYTELTRTSIKPTLKMLRRLPWDEGCESMLVKCFVKAHRGKYGHIHLMASLISGLTAYHEGLGVKVVDQLLEEIRAGLEKMEFSQNQRRVLHMKLLGELYNYCMFDSNIIFDTLYTLLFFGKSSNTFPLDSSANPPPSSDSADPALDPPQDWFRLRLVCTLLDTCGQFFDRGTAKRRLDTFLLYLQKYIIGKGIPPPDMEFTIQDTFEALRPKMKRFRTFQEVAEEIAKQEAEDRKQISSEHLALMIQGSKPSWESEAYRAAARAAAATPQQGPQIESPRADEDVRKGRGVQDDDDEDEEEARQPAADEAEEEEDEDEDDDDESESESEDEEEDDEKEKEEDDEIVVRSAQSTVDEDDEFERELAKMMQESVDARKHERKAPVNNLANLTIPAPFAVPASAPQVPSADLNTSQTEDEPTNTDNDTPSGMPFQVLLRNKGAKQAAPQTRNIVIPITSHLAISAQNKQREERDEQLALKRLVLQYEQREEEAANNNAKFIIVNNPTPAAAPGAAPGGQRPLNPKAKKIIFFGGGGGRGGKR